MTALRRHLLLGTALIAAAGCAQQPVRSDYMTPPASAATATSSVAAAPSQVLTKAFPPSLLVFAYDQGWRQVVVVGNNHYFCRTDAAPGSLINGRYCITQWEMQTERLLVQQQQEKLRQPIPYLPMRYP